MVFAQLTLIAKLASEFLEAYKDLTSVPDDELAPLVEIDLTEAREKIKEMKRVIDEVQDGTDRQVSEIPEP
jgi:hypothetical protein